MRAIVHEKFGSPEVLQFIDIAKPNPKDDEVLVKVHAASLNFGDVALVKGQPFLVRLMGYGFFKPKYLIPGGDFAGIVEAVGAGVKKFQPGDAVFADIGGVGFGACAEYATAPEAVLVPKPLNLTFEQAAAVPQAAVVALQGMRDHGKVQSGQ